MRTADILDTLERLVQDIETGRLPDKRQIHKLKTWLRKERERIDEKRPLTAQQTHKMTGERKRNE